ncbi:hypothetical protein GH714_032268 [Hevea brasiliensis]|uniref:Reverse transcriptase Ty1/copia-type domain-containing protein n=1 Tax=Hevea brasiliensis TaxID=3981 RepID=A0A6A6L1Q8_HEVBR|nr:hypothetical protein GH714_032268 [Hevea brasiliensis]
MHSPTKHHFGAAKRILQYIAGTMEYGIWYSQKSECKLFGYMDSDWAACQAVWLRRLLVDFGQEQKSATEIFCDNSAAIAMAKNPAFHGRTKHIDWRHHFIHDLVTDSEIALKFCSTNEQVAAILTKALSYEKHAYFISQLGVSIALSSPPGEVLRPPPHSPSSGAVPMSLPQCHAPPLPPAQQPLPPPTVQQQQLLGPSPSLYKQHSWSPDIYRDEAWLRRKGNCKNRRSKSVTDEDLDELKGCIELGFGFDSPEVDQRLSDTLPALGLYHAVNKHYYDTLFKSVTATTTSSLSTASDCDSPSPLGSPHAIFGPGDNPQTMKTRLRQWAQVVACSVRQCSSSS